MTAHFRFIPFYRAPASIIYKKSLFLKKMFAKFVNIKNLLYLCTKVIIMATLGYSFYPLHPGEVLKDEMEARHISQREFARQVDMSYTVLNELLNGKRPLTPATALMFEAALDVPADALMAIQTKYNMQTARQDSKIMSWLAQIPRVAAML